MKERVVTGLLMAIVAIAILLYAPVWILALVLTGIVLGCFLEYTAMMAIPRHLPALWIALFFTMITAIVMPIGDWAVATGYANTWMHTFLSLKTFLLPLMLIAVWLSLFRSLEPFSESVRRLHGLVFAVIYMSALGYAMMTLALSFERGYLFFLLAATHAADAAAFFVGKRFGKRPFSSRLSPKKTWEGFVGGLLASVVSGFICVALFHLAISPLVTIVLSLAVGISAALGDLAESMLKRSQGVKDSAAWIPGHGGVLDRVDGLFFSAPVLCALLSVFGT